MTPYPNFITALGSGAVDLASCRWGVALLAPGYPFAGASKHRYLTDLVEPAGEGYSAGGQAVNTKASENPLTIEGDPVVWPKATVDAAGYALYVSGGKGAGLLAGYERFVDDEGRPEVKVAVRQEISIELATPMLRILTMEK